MSGPNILFSYLLPDTSALLNDDKGAESPQELLIH